MGGTIMRGRSCDSIDGKQATRFVVLRRDIGGVRIRHLCAACIARERNAGAVVHDTRTRRTSVVWVTVLTELWLVPFEASKAPTVASLNRDTSYSRAAIRAALRGLMSRGWARSLGDNSGYELTVEGIDACRELGFAGEPSAVAA